MSLYAEYIKEREDADIIENDKAFLSYRYTRSRREIYIIDCFVKKEYRNQREAKKLFEQLEIRAKELDCLYILASVDMGTNGWEHSLSKLDKNGFIYDWKINTQVFVRKDIRNG